MIDTAFSSAIGYIVNPSPAGFACGMATSFNSIQLCENVPKRNIQVCLSGTFAAYKLIFDQILIKVCSIWFPPKDCSTSVILKNCSTLVTLIATCFTAKISKSNQIAPHITSMIVAHAVGISIISWMAPSDLNLQVSLFFLREMSEACCNQFLEEKNKTCATFSKLAAVGIDSFLAYSMLHGSSFPFYAAIGLMISNHPKILYKTLIPHVTLYAPYWLIGFAFKNEWLSQSSSFQFFPFIPYLGYQGYSLLWKPNLETGKSNQNQMLLQKIEKIIDKHKANYPVVFQELERKVSELSNETRFKESFFKRRELLMILQRINRKIRDRALRGNPPLEDDLFPFLGEPSTEKLLEQLENDSLILNEILNSDPFLRDYICGIERNVARNPCIEPTNPLKIYNYETLIRWLSRNPSSPATGKRIVPSEVIRLPKLKAFIHHRIENFTDDPDEDLLGEAEAELASYREPRELGG